MAANLDASLCSDLFDIVDAFDYRDPDGPSLQESLAGRAFQLTADDFNKFLDKIYDSP